MTKSATWRNTPFAHRFYHSVAWANTRMLVLDRSNGLCEKCLEAGKVVLADVVHHIVPLSEENMDDQSITLNPDNLMALCHECHTEAHRQLGVGKLNGNDEEPRVGFDEEGNVVRL